MSVSINVIEQSSSIFWLMQNNKPIFFCVVERQEGRFEADHPARDH